MRAEAPERKASRPERNEFGSHQASSKRWFRKAHESSKRWPRMSRTSELPSARKIAAGPRLAATSSRSPGWARRRARTKGIAMTESPSQFGATTNRERPVTTPPPPRDSFRRPRPPAIVHPEPGARIAANRAFRDGHEAGGRPRDPLVAPARRFELGRNDRLFESEPVPALPPRPREGRHDGGVGLHLEKGERRRSRGEPAEEGDEDPLVGEHVLVDHDRDRASVAKRAQDLPGRLLFSDEPVPEARAPPRQLLLETGGVERAHDRCDPMAEKARAHRSQLPVPEVRREEEDALAAGARALQVLGSRDGDAVLDLLAREARRVEKLEERRSEVLEARARERGDL